MEHYNLVRSLSVWSDAMPNAAVTSGSFRFTLDLVLTTKLFAVWKRVLFNTAPDLRPRDYSESGLESVTFLATLAVGIGRNPQYR